MKLMLKKKQKRMKEEMLNDGQDEPVTSMPMKKHKTERSHSIRAENLVISPSDPIMNAPSC